MGCYVNLCDKQAVSFYFAFKDFIGNTLKYRGLQLSFEERSPTTSHFFESQDDEWKNSAKHEEPTKCLCFKSCCNRKF